MKVKLLVDTMISVKGGTVIDIDDAQYSVLKKLNRCIPFEAEKTIEKVEEPKKETRKKKSEK